MQPRQILETCMPVRPSVVVSTMPPPTHDRRAPIVPRREGRRTDQHHVGVLGVGEALEHHPPRCPGRVERAALDQALDRALVDRARVDPLLELMGGLAVAGVLAIGGWRIAQGAGSVGDFTGFITALLMAAQRAGRRARGPLSVL